MNPAPPRTNRLRAYMEFLAAVCYFFLARSLAHQAAQGLAADRWMPLVERVMLAFLLLVGYAGMGFWLDRELQPISQQGFPRRKGYPRELGQGLAFGWALALVCILPLLISGGIAVSFTFEGQAWGMLLVDAAFFAFLALAEEVAFRGYAFQRFARALGPVGASAGFAVYYALVQRFALGASHASFAVSLVLGLLLSAAFLRTRALWLSWGLNFGWKASRALLFGLAVSGDSSHSPVVQGDPMGPLWLTGGGFGLDASWTALLILLAAFPVLFRITRDLDFQHNAPELVPGGIPVDLDAAARAQHQAAMGPAETAGPVLVQIVSVSAPVHEAHSPQFPTGDRNDAERRDAERTGS
jgi:uncharacterized protein